MSRTDLQARRLEPVFVDHFPEHLEAGRLYISIPYNTTGHLCACGCGAEVVAPLSPAQWRVTYDGRDITLHPSIGNWNIACHSHYWIDRGRIRWSNRFTPEEIARAQQRDEEALRHLSQEPPLTQHPWLKKLRKMLRRQ